MLSQLLLVMTIEQLQRRYRLKYEADFIADAASFRDYEQADEVMAEINRLAW